VLSFSYAIYLLCLNEFRVRLLVLVLHLLLLLLITY